MADSSYADHDPAGLSHRLIDCLTVMKLRVNSLQLRLREGTATRAALAETLALLEQEITSAGELAQVLRAQAAPLQERGDDSGAWAGATDPGGG